MATHLEEAVDCAAWEGIRLEEGTMKDVHAGDEGPFAEIDPKLTVFALANGLDLTKADGHRRLEWFSDGFERAIRIDAVGEGRYGVAVFRWKSGSDELGDPAPVREAVDATGVVGVLDEAVEAANGL